MLLTTGSHITAYQAYGRACVELYDNSDVPSTRVASYSSSIKLELYFSARVLERIFCKRQTAMIKTRKHLAQTFVTHLRDNLFNLARDDANQSTDCPRQISTIQVLAMTHTAPNDSCSLAPDINTLTYLLTYLPCRVLEYSIRHWTEYSSHEKLDSPSPNDKQLLWSTANCHSNTYTDSIVIYSYMSLCLFVCLSVCLCVSCGL